MRTASSRGDLGGRVDWGSSRFSAASDLVERVRRATGQSYSIERITQVAREVAQQFQDARVTAFLPVLIERKTSERLKAERTGSPR